MQAISAAGTQVAPRAADLLSTTQMAIGVRMDLFTSSYGQAGGWSVPLDGTLDGGQTLVLAFAAPEFGVAPAPFRDLVAAFPRAVIAGCSTAGEIAAAEVRDASVSVAVARFEHTALRRVGTALAGAEDSFAAGVRLAAQLAPPAGGQRLRAVFLLCEGLAVNGTPLVAGLTRHLPPGVAISGGLAGDGSRFGQTWVLDGAQPTPRHLCAVGLYGERLRTGLGCDGGWSDFGPERHITRSRGNVLYELDGKPALELYKTYLGDRAAGLPGTALLFPLAIRREGGGGESLVRTILGVDEAEQSLTFAGDMPQGAVARLMRANTDKLIGSAGQAGRAAAVGADSAAGALVISVSCVGRRLVLGERTEEEVEAVNDSAGPHAAHVGFYSYGEVSAAMPGASDLHNQTMTVTVYSEA
jgi:hypothetical protein